MRSWQKNAGWIATGIVLALAVSIAHAEPEVWLFDLSTQGEDVEWYADTTVDPDAMRYDAEWTITLLEARVRYGFLPAFWVDVTNEIPDEYQNGAESADGPAPVVIFQDTIVYPEPPEPEAFSADLTIELSPAGRGHVEARNIYLGEAEVYVDGIGTVTVDILEVHIQGSVSVDAIPYPVGDMNCDGVIDFADINPFVTALTGIGPYEANYPGCDWLNGDVNNDGTVDFMDINPFVGLLSGGA